MMECPTDGCDYLFFKEEANQTYHFCPACGVEYCIKCDTVYHVESTCDEYLEAKRLAAAQARVDNINN